MRSKTNVTEGCRSSSRPARRLARGLARNARGLRLGYLVSLARVFPCPRPVRPAEIDRTLMRRNRLILTNRSADRTAWSTLLNYLRFIKYISNAVLYECADARARARAQFHCHDVQRTRERICVRARACVYARDAICVYAYVRPRYIMYESVLVGKRPPLARRGLT